MKLVRLSLAIFVMSFCTVVFSMENVRLDINRAESIVASMNDTLSTTKFGSKADMDKYACSQLTEATHFANKADMGAQAAIKGRLSHADRVEAHNVRNRAKKVKNAANERGCPVGRCCGTE